METIKYLSPPPQLEGSVCEEDETPSVELHIHITNKNTKLVHAQWTYRPQREEIEEASILPRML
jgi:DUF1365 family protein